RAGERATAENSVVPFNRLMSYRGVHYRYDEFGQTVEKEGRSGTQSYRYDAEHRMVEVTTARGTYRYVYDALGRRTEKQHISPDGKPYNRTTFLWDGMRLAQESRPEGTGSLYIYRDPGSYEPLARVDKAGKEGPNRILYFHTDVNGAPEEMTDSDGKIVWETGYQVWGKTIQEKDHGGVEQNLRYQGQYLDRETGLHYNLHRYYDPDVGRFIVTDPIGLRGGLNLYRYAPNPLSWIDPLGLFGCGPKAQQHILHGDGPGSGGHMWPGQPGKTTFPQSWDAKKIISEVDDIVNSPSTKWYAQQGTGGALTKAGKAANWVAWEVRDGVQIRVVFQPAKGRIVTAFPDSGPIPPLPGAK
ncbi:TPA: RHS domain-containing protein, partial [Escherichia coli]|nr:RHS domain-containing protein [Escherichia coli]